MKKTNTTTEEINNSEKFFLIDGSSFLYRSYYSLPPMYTKQGGPVQVVYGFCRMVKKIAKQFNPRNLAVVWDPSDKTETFRHKIYENYKIQREASPLELNLQRNLVKEFATIIGLKQFTMPAIEADDILYSIAKELERIEKKVILITSDKDMGQCISEKISIFDPFKNEFRDENYIQLRYGVPVSKLVFYFALVGDSSDNIPGARGIGPKTAKDLVNKFESLENLYENLETVEKTRTKKLLEESKENAFLSKRLFKLQYQKVESIPKELEFSMEKNWIKAQKFFERLDFISLLKELNIEKQNSSQNVTLEDKIDSKRKIPAKFFTISNTKDLKKLCKTLESKKVFSLDTETNGTNPLLAKLVGISICAEPGKAHYIPINSPTKINSIQSSFLDNNTNQKLSQESNQNFLALQDILEELGPILKNPSIKKHLHHAKFDKIVLHKSGLNLNGIEFDTIIAANLVAKDWHRNNLKWLSSYYLSQDMLTYDEVVKKNKYKDFSQVPIDLATEYSAADAHQTFMLVKILKEELEKNKLLQYFWKIEMPLMELLCKMEIEGISVNKNILENLEIKINIGIEKTEEKIMSLLPDNAKLKINLNSSKQLEDLIFNRLKLKPIKKTGKKTGYSTDQEVLKTLAKTHPIPALILKYRELYKLKSTYIISLKSSINPKSKKIHTSFRQTGISTGRLASLEPNLQNIPIGNTYQIRSAFIPSDKHIFLSADYSQIELRVLAHLSQDASLLQAFREDADIHKKTAASIFNTSLEKVTNSQRNIAKRINFGIIYGLSPYGLSSELAISFKEASDYIKKYFEQYPGVIKWMDSVVNQTINDGYVKTLMGRRRYLPKIREKNKNIQELSKRLAINTAVQGTAAEVMKLGMIELDKSILKQKLNAKLLLQIHDELILEVPEENLEKTQNIVKESLENIVNWNVKLNVNLKAGENWQKITKT